MKSSIKGLIPEIGSRAFIVGKTGSGKSFLAKYLLDYSPQKYVVIIDPKGTFEYEGTIITSPDDLGKLTENDTVIIYRPDYEYHSMAEYERVLKWVYYRQNTLLYIDELYALSDNGRTYPQSLRALYTRGRALNITVIGGTQRPANVEVTALSECEYFYCFLLNTDDDRKKMSNMMGREVRQVPKDEYAFWFYNHKLHKSEVVKLG